MSAKAVGWVWEHSPYRSTNLLVHLAIADASDDDGTFDIGIMSLVTMRARCMAFESATWLQRMFDDGLVEHIDGDTYRLKL